MQLRLESRTFSDAIQACMDLLEGSRIVVVMGDRLALKGICLAPVIAPRLVNALHSEDRPKFVEDLSEREKEVVSAVAGGLTNAEIATAFQISTATVKSHVSNAMNKLAVRDRTQLAVSALLYGLIDPQMV